MPNLAILISLVLSLLLYYLKLISPQIATYILAIFGIIATIPVVISAGKALLEKKVSVDLLASIALFVSLWQREWISVAFINLMITSARIFGDYTENRAKAAIKSLLKLRPEIVKVRSDDQIISKHISEIKVGDIVVVESGDRIPVDGIIKEGEASVDQSSLTGESIPVPKSQGDRVFSSTLSLSGSLIVVVEKTGKDTTFEKIVNLVEAAQLQKIGIQSTADKFAGWYIVITFMASTLIYFYTRNIPLVLSILLVTCADDIAVAIPMAFWASVGYAARQGIVVKGGNFLEGLARLKVFVADKTGTLTRGKVNIEEAISVGGTDKKDVLKYAAIAESVSQHPIAKVIVEFAKKESLAVSTPQHPHEYPGRGIVATYNGKKIHVGSLSFLREEGFELSSLEVKEVIKYEDKGYGVTLVGLDKKIIGFLALADEIRPDAKETIDKLKKMGVARLIMLTGDNERVAFRVARALGIPEYHANLLPADKVKFIKGYERAGGTLAMVGDGVNDAASLALADIGIAMGAIGADSAIEAADIAIMQNKFSKVADVVSLGKYTTSIAKQNFLIWGIVNTIGLILVFAKVIGPVGASAYNFVTDFFPIVNSLRIFGLYLKPRSV